MESWCKESFRLVLSPLFYGERKMNRNHIVMLVVVLLVGYAAGVFYPSPGNMVKAKLGL